MNDVKEDVFNDPTHQEILNEMPNWLKDIYLSGRWKEYRDFPPAMVESQMTIYSPATYIKWRNLYNDPTKVGHRLREFCSVYAGQGEVITGLFHAGDHKGYIIRTGVPCYAHTVMERILRMASDNELQHRSVNAQHILEMTKDEIWNAEIQQFSC